MTEALPSNSADAVRSHRLKAIGLALVAYTLWVLADASMKMASEAHLPPYETVGFLGMFGAMFMVLKGGTRPAIAALWPQNPKSQFMRAILALAVNICNAIAFNHIPLTLFYVTVFTAPLVVSLLAAVVLRERLSRVRLMAVLGGFIGVVIAINPLGAERQGDWIGYGAALLGVLCYAGSTVWLRVMSQNESAESVVFFTCLVEMISGFALMFFHAVPLDLRLFAILVVMGFFCAVGNLLMTRALKAAPAALISQFHYSQIIGGALIGYLLWHEIPTWNMAAGFAVIVACGMIAVAKRHQD